MSKKKRIISLWTFIKIIRTGPIAQRQWGDNLSTKVSWCTVVLQYRDDLRITSYVFCMEGVGKTKKKKRERQVKDKRLKKLYAEKKKKNRKRGDKKKRKMRKRCGRAKEGWLGTFFHVLYKFHAFSSSSPILGLLEASSHRPITRKYCSWVEGRQIDPAPETPNSSGVTLGGYSFTRVNIQNA